MLPTLSPDMLAGLLISGFGWGIAYVDIVNRGFRDKTYGMPLFALALNISWEFLVGFVINTENNIYRWISGLWCVMDLFILYTYFRFGRRYFPAALAGYFVPWSLAAFVTGAIAMTAIIIPIGTWFGTLLTAWPMTLIMSISFVAMLHHRDGVEGQSLYIAISKFVGSLGAAYVLWRIGTVSFLLPFAALVILYDVLYIGLLYKTFRRLALSPFTRQPLAPG